MVQMSNTMIHYKQLLKIPKTTAYSFYCNLVIWHSSWQAFQENESDSFQKIQTLAIHHTRCATADPCKHILGKSHKYVLLGQFTSDHLEKEYEKLRQDCGGMHFLTVQQIIEKVSIKQSSVLLKLNVDPNSLFIQSGHHCASCDHRLSQKMRKFLIVC